MGFHLHEVPGEVPFTVTESRRVCSGGWRNGGVECSKGAEPGFGKMKKF